jgi:hypothetical protein
MIHARGGWRDTTSLPGAASEIAFMPNRSLLPVITPRSFLDAIFIEANLLPGRRIG